MFNVKVDPKQFADLETKVRQKFLDVLAEPALMQDVGAFMKQRVVYQAKIKKPLTQFAEFPELTDKWVKERTKLSEFNATDTTFSPGRSNLTFTGQLLGSYDFEVTGPGQIRLGFSGTHEPYKTKNGQRGKPVLNETIAEGLKAKGYQVIDQSVQTNKTIVQRIKSIALTYLRKSLKQTTSQS